ncbi:MAG TPA: LapA family protein [Deltaproteobacteria bacterium]|nr:LapA family protein [Deltaproteobacteria bacterium]HPR54293.1 LapA family protein [Deltaproteobacteria bacterium]HXK45795.1 LapA family protein [Deltaproteobacteria bacterium]
MRYLNTVLSILVLLAIITFCVHNTQEFTLNFLGYQLLIPLQLWVLMVVFFIAGMVPILVVEIPVQAARFMRIRALKVRIRDLDAEISRASAATGEPGKDVSEKP